MDGGLAADADGGAGTGGDGGAVTNGDEPDVREAGLRGAAIAYAELVRVPNLFTAPPDVLVGASLAAVAGGSVSPVALAGVAFASMVLYAGGTTLNDAFDAPIDARERSERPIPSGRVSRRSAFGFGVGLLVIGVAVAFAAAGHDAALAAGLLALAVVLYDGVLKGTVPGFLAMGATRGLNVVLGTTVGAVTALWETASRATVPLVIAAYIAAVTYVAARETKGENRGAVATAGVGGLAAVGVLAWYLAAVRPSGLETILAAALAGAFLVWIGRPLRAAYRDPVPGTVGPAVGACVVGLVIIDAAFAAAAGVGWAIATVAFLLPTRVLARIFDVT